MSAVTKTEEPRRCCECDDEAKVGMGLPPNVRWLCAQHFDAAMADVARIINAAKEAARGD